MRPLGVYIGVNIMVKKMDIKCRNCKRELDFSNGVIMIVCGCGETTEKVNYIIEREVI